MQCRLVAVDVCDCLPARIESFAVVGVCVGGWQSHAHYRKALVGSGGSVVLRVEGDELRALPGNGLHPENVAGIESWVDEASMNFDIERDDAEFRFDARLVAVVEPGDGSVVCHRVPKDRRHSRWCSG